jgi:hypothetical protein
MGREVMERGERWPLPSGAARKARRPAGGDRGGGRCPGVPVSWRGWKAALGACSRRKRSGGVAGGPGRGAFTPGPGVAGADGPAAFPAAVATAVASAFLGGGSDAVI